MRSNTTTQAYAEASVHDQFLSLGDDRSDSPIISDENLTLHTTVLNRVHEEKDAALIHCGPFASREEMLDVVIDWGAQLGAIGLSFASLVFFGLSLNEEDLPSGSVRGIFAFAAFAANAAQISVSGKIALQRNLNYLKHFILAIAKGRVGIKELFHSKRKAAYFIATEITKWVVLYFVSNMAPSLALQVDWFQSDSTRIYIQTAIMMMLEPAIHDRIHDFALPIVTTDQIVKDERNKFRQTYYKILNLNALAARDKRILETELLDMIDSRNHHGIIHKILAPSRDNTASLLSDARAYFGIGITAFLAIIYFMSNTGAYIQTINNPDADVASRYGSVFGDTCFGIFMAIRGGTAIADLWGQLRTWAYRHPRRAMLTIVSTGIACLTIGSTLAPNEEAGMPWWILIGGVAGTIFDNTYFLTELMTEAEASLALHSKNRDGERHQRAIIEYYYHELQKAYDEMSDVQFLACLYNVTRANPTSFTGYETYFYKKLPWAKDNSKIGTITDIIGHLKSPAINAIAVIDHNGQFGVKRHCIELGGSAVAMLVIGLGLIPAEQPTAVIFSQFFIPIIAVPIGLGVIGLFSNCWRKQNTPKMSVPKQTIEVSAQTLTTHNLLKTAIALGLPISVKYGAKIPLSWILANIFGASADDAETMSTHIADTFSVITAGALTHHTAVSMR
jgi:uncharacterized membrane protein YdcZ (DUF606 family)